MKESIHPPPIPQPPTHVELIDQRKQQRIQVHHRARLARDNERTQAAGQGPIQVPRALDVEQVADEVVGRLDGDRDALRGCPLLCGGSPGALRGRRRGRHESECKSHYH